MDGTTLASEKLCLITRDLSRDGRECQSASRQSPTRFVRCVPMQLAVHLLPTSILNLQKRACAWELLQPSKFWSRNSSLYDKVTRSSLTTILSTRHLFPA